jgi:hypothetical protein
LIFCQADGGSPQSQNRGQEENELQTAHGTPRHLFALPSR